MTLALFAVALAHEPSNAANGRARVALVALPALRFATAPRDIRTQSDTCAASGGKETT